MHEIRGTSPDYLIVDDRVCPSRDEERPICVLVVGEGRDSTIRAVLAAIRESGGLPLLVSQESLCEAERSDEGQPACYFPVHQIQAPEAGMIDNICRMLAAMHVDYVAYNHPRPRRAKRNKQTNKKKNFNRR